MGILKLLLITIISTGLCRGQEINWKPCEDVIAPMKAAVEKFNTGRTDGLSIWLSCRLGKSTADKKAQKPPRHIPLTAEEIVFLSRLRKESKAAYEAQDAYEKFLIVKHGVNKPEIGEPCYRFVGFVLDDNFITDDQTPMTQCVNTEYR